MKSPTLLWNKTLIKHFIAQTSWITILYTVMSLIVIPFGLWISSVNLADAEVFDTRNLLQMVAWYHLAFGLIYAAILGLFSVNFKNKENVSDFIHALPVKKITVLTSVYISGILSMTIPTIVIAVILVFQRHTFFFEVAVSDIAAWLVYSVTMMVVMFIFTILAGFLTNHLFVHLQLIVIIFFLPVALWNAVVTTASTLYDGIAGYQGNLNEGLLSPVVSNTFPILAMSQIFDPFSWWKTAVWIGAALAGVLLSYILYSKRKNERVNSNFTYPFVRMILSVLITILGMLVFGNLMEAILSGNTILRVIAFVLGWIASYIIVEMLFQSTVKIQLKIRGFIMSIAGTVLFLLLFYAGWSMYLNYVPAADEVASVRVNEGYFEQYDENGIVMNEGFMMVEDEQFIEDVLQAHQFAVDHRGSGDADGETTKFEVIYNMEDKDRVHRNFHHFPATDEGLAILQALRDYPKVEFEDAIYNVDHAENIERLGLLLNYQSKNPVYIHDESELEKFVEDYQNELESTINGNPLLLQMESEQPLNAEVKFSNGEYEETVYGRSVLYNPAVISKISEKTTLSEFISLDRSENVYSYEITGEAKEFYDDIRYSTFDELQNQYDIEALDAEEETEIIEEINRGNISPHSDRIIIYENPYHSSEDMEFDPANDTPEWDWDTHFIIGIE